MTVALTGTGGLFKRVGHYGGASADVIALHGGTATARVLSGASMQTRATTLETDAAESPAVSDILGDHWTIFSSFESSSSGFFQSLSSKIQAIVIRQVDLDASLPSKDLTTALTELIRQMRAAAAEIQESTIGIGSQADVGSPTGDPTFVISQKDPEGYIPQCSFAETVRFEVTNDSYLGATARQEPVSVRGEAAVSSVYSREWPGGSGANMQISLTDCKLDNSGGNKLTNSDFETFSTTNYPDNWVIQTGVVTTNVLAAGVSDAYLGSNAVKFLGDAGGTLTAIYQEFNKTASTTAGAGGTTGTLLPRTQYALVVATKVDTGTVAGVLALSLVDGDGTVINDDAGTANTLSITLSGESTSYALHTASFRTPSLMPTTVRLRIKLTTAITDTKQVYIDNLALTPMTEMYTGGLWVAGFAGITKVVKADKYTIAITNTMGVMASWCERFFDLRSKRLVIPYSGSPEVADSLVA